MRFVRVTDDLLAQLELLLPAERPGDGRPSLHDFLRTDMVAIQDHFAEHWDELGMTVPGRADYRTYQGVGTHVARFAVDGQLAADGYVDLTNISLELRGPDDEVEEAP